MSLWKPWENPIFAYGKIFGRKMKKSIFVDVGIFSVLRGLHRAYWGPVNRFSEFVAGSRSKIEKSIFWKNPGLVPIKPKMRVLRGRVWCLLKRLSGWKLTCGLPSLGRCLKKSFSPALNKKAYFSTPSKSRFWPFFISGQFLSFFGIFAIHTPKSVGSTSSRFLGPNRP